MQTRVWACCFSIHSGSETGCVLKTILPTFKSKDLEAKDESFFGGLDSMSWTGAIVCPRKHDHSLFSMAPCTLRTDPKSNRPCMINARDLTLDQSDEPLQDDNTTRIKGDQQFSLAFFFQGGSNLSTPVLASLVGKKQCPTAVLSAGVLGGSKGRQDPFTFPHKGK